MKIQKSKFPSPNPEKQGYNLFGKPHPPKAFTQKVVLKAAKVYAESYPNIVAVGWRWKTRKDQEPEAIVGFFIQRGKGKKQNPLLPNIPKEINLVELFEGEPVELYGLTTVSTRQVLIRKLCGLGRKKKGVRSTSSSGTPVALAAPILQPGEVIYHPDQNKLGTICALVKKTNAEGKEVTHILSAMHVLADGNAVTTNDPVFQPNKKGNLRKVGELSIIGQSEVASPNSMNDFALSRITSTRQRRSEIKGVGQPAAPVDAILTDQTVVKSGFSSGVTYGRVFYTSVAFSNANTNTFNPDIFGFIIVELHTNPPVLFEHFATAGDSGAVVAVVESNGDIRPAGLLVSLSQIDGLGPGFVALSLTDIITRVGGELYV